MQNFRLATYAALVTFFATSTPTSLKAAPDNTLGMAIMFAYVGADGTLQNGSGATGASRGSLGGYRVTFDRDVSNCGYSATVYNSIGRTAVVMPSDNNATVIVATSTSQNLSDNNFYLLVYCTR